MRTVGWEEGQLAGRVDWRQSKSDLHARGTPAGVSLFEIEVDWGKNRLSSIMASRDPVDNDDDDDEDDEDDKTVGLALTKETRKKTRRANGGSRKRRAVCWLDPGMGLVVIMAQRC